MIRPQTVSRYASMVKFSHTIFAMPFALVGYAYAAANDRCGIFAAAARKGTACNGVRPQHGDGIQPVCRPADRRAEPRHRNREIPAGIITPRRALIFVIVNAALFLAVAL